MQLMFIVLNKVEALDSLLEEMMKNGVRGATIMNSTGMAHELAKSGEDFPIFGTLRLLLDPERSESKTIFMVLREDEVDKVKNIVKSVIGDLSKPDTGIIFTVPVSSAEGIIGG